jgi:hypothetical protein
MPVVVSPGRDRQWRHERGIAPLRLRIHHRAAPSDGVIHDQPHGALGTLSEVGGECVVDNAVQAHLSSGCKNAKGRLAAAFNSRTPAPCYLVVAL